MLTPLLLSCLTSFAATQDVVPRDYLTIAPVDSRGRRPFRPDAVFAEHIWPLEAEPPVAGASMTGERGEAAEWKAAEADENGKLSGRFGYAYTKVVSAAREVRLARLAGASTLYVNGEAFAGDVYRFGFGGVPVLLEEGDNHVYVTGSRGGFNLTFRDIEEGLHHGGWDDTLPHLVAGEAPRGAIGLELSNLSATATGPILIRYGGEAIAQNQVYFRGLAPLGVNQFALPLSGELVADDRTEPVEVRVRVTHASPASKAAAEPSPALEFTLSLSVRQPGEKVLRTYVSDVDSSVQRYALVPPAPAPEEAPESDFMGMVLSLHGASVTAWRQAACYRQRPDFWLVAPENRRAFGFDWQDWGRRDAYDVLALALEESGVDRRHTFVTGHSMGGHGTWHMAANDLDGFAACAPSAGWESFDSYGGRPEGALRELWHAADGSSKTLDLISNLKQLPVYVLHGTADSTVRAKEALTMMTALSEANGTFEAHFQGGAGHWWGDQCMDWPPIFDFFRGKSIPDDPDSIDFKTISPATDSAHHWVRVEQPLRYGAPLRVKGDWQEDESKAVLTTENVALLSLNRRALIVELDGQVLEVEGRKGDLWFERQGEAWQQADGGPADESKRAARSGTLKRAFDHDFLMVVGTGGTQEEDVALAARAAHDAGVWRYRGNGRAEIWTDATFAARITETAERNVILYGNRHTNGAWGLVLDAACPIDVARGRVELRQLDGTSETFDGDDLGCVFVYPRLGEKDCLVGVFGDAGPRATRLGSTLAPFVSGVGYPDFAVFDSNVLRQGDGGVRRAGWMDSQWRLQAEDLEPENASSGE